MSDVAKKVLRRIRGTRLPPMAIPAMTAAELERITEYTAEFWERDKKTVRAQNFEKAQIGLAEYRERQKQEKERQIQIAEARLKNLKKARRAKKKQNE